MMKILVTTRDVPVMDSQRKHKLSETLSWFIVRNTLVQILVQPLTIDQLGARSLNSVSDFLIKKEKKGKNVAQGVELFWELKSDT